MKINQTYYFVMALCVVWGCQKEDKKEPPTFIPTREEDAGLLTIPIPTPIRSADYRPISEPVMTKKIVKSNPDIGVENFCTTGRTKTDYHDSADSKHWSIKKHNGKPSLKPAVPNIIGGTFDKQIIKRVVNQKKAEVTQCYNRVLRSDPDMSGIIKLRWSILSSGNVGNVEILMNRISVLAVSECLKNRVKNWKFPAPKDGQEISVEYSFGFFADNTAPPEQIIDELSAQFEKLSLLEKRNLVLAYVDTNQPDKVIALYKQFETDFLNLYPHEFYNLFLDMQDSLKAREDWPALKARMGAYQNKLNENDDAYERHIELAESSDDPSVKCREYGLAYQSYPRHYHTLFDIRKLTLDAQAMQSCVTDAILGLPTQRDIVLILLWEDRCADLDMYITEADGQVVHWQQHRSTSGGLLQTDATGYGPEVYTLAAALPGEYEVDVEYHTSGDGSDLPTSGTLIVITRAGSPDEKRQALPFTISSRGERQTLYTLRVQ